MKKYVMLYTFTATIAVWLMILPLLSAMSVTEVLGLKATYAVISSFVDCTGSVDAANQQIVGYGYSIKPEKIYVKVGDMVQVGQKLMDIDKEDTLDAFNTLPSVNGGGNNAGQAAASSDAGGNDSSDLSGLLSQYYGTSESDQASDDGGSVPVQNIPEIPDNVCSDISGVVTEINANDGSFTQPTASLIVIADLSSIQIKAQVDERMVTKVHVGQSAVISGNALEKNYSGKVSQIYPAARTIMNASGAKTVVDIIISIDNADSDLKPGLNTNIKIHSAQNNQAIMLPYSAVGEDNANIKYVYIAADGRAVRKNIITGNEYADTVEIKGGIKAGDMVITNLSAVSKNGVFIRLNNTDGEKND